MDTVTITIEVNDWRDHNVGHDRKEATLRVIADRALTLICRHADDMGIAVHAQHDLEY